MMLRTIITSLVLAIVAAVAEVLSRWHLYPETVQAPQLTLAVCGNVAVLGILAMLLAMVGWGAGRLLTYLVPVRRSAVETYRPCILLGLVLAALVFLTEGLAIGGRITNPLLGTMGILALGAAAGAYVRYGQRRARPGMSALTLAAAVMVWLFCLVITTGAVAKTNGAVNQWIAGPGESASPGNSHAPNIVLVVVDTLRADHVGVHDSGGPSLTPNIDRFAESSIVYTKALSTAPWTLPSHASLFTGLYPEVHGVSWGHYKLSDQYPVLPQLLGEKGYDTFAVSNNWLLSKVNGFARGFDTFIETATDPHLTSWRLALQCGTLRALVPRVGLALEVADDAGSSWTNWLVRRRLAQGDSAERPILVFINYFEPHDPYRPPPRYLETHLTPAQRQAYRHLDQRQKYLAAQACGSADVYTAGQIALMERLYQAEVEYQDHKIGELLSILKEAGRFDNSWIIITSDHGELFGEWDMLWHTASSHYQLLHVPLIVRPPGGADGRRLEMPVQPVDLFVTLLEETGIAVPAAVRRAYPLPSWPDQQTPRKISIAQSHGASIAGLSMTQGMNMQADLAHWLTWTNSVYADGYLLETNSAGVCALFDVINDPAMELNQADLEPEKVEAMITAFSSWRRSHGDHDGGGKTEAHARLHSRD